MRWLASFDVHQHAGAGAVGQLRGVAGGDERAGLDPLPVGEHRLQRRKASQGRVGARPFVLLQGDRLVGDGAGRLVGDLHHGGQGRDLGVEPASGLRRGGSLLRLQRVFVLALTRDLVSLRHDLGRLDHRHVDVVAMLDEPGILSAIAVHLVVLDQRNRFKPAANGDAHAVVDDFLCRGRDRHQARGALPVERHAGDAGRKAGAQERLSRDIAALRSLLHRCAHHHVVDLAGIDGCALKRVRDRMAAERLGLRVVERAAIGLADRRTRGGDDDGFTHDGSPGVGSLVSPHPSRLRRATFSPREKGLLH